MSDFGDTRSESLTGEQVDPLFPEIDVVPRVEEKGPRRTDDTRVPPPSRSVSQPPSQIPPSQPPSPRATLVAVKRSTGERDSNAADDDDQLPQSWLGWIQGAPPWLFSMVVHMLGMVILGVLLMHQDRESALEVEMVFSDRLGDQLDTEVIELTNEEPRPDIEEVAVAPMAPLQPDPLVSPPVATETTEAVQAMTPLPVPNIGTLLTGRDEGMREALRVAYGGNIMTEQAVQAGLEWLKRNQLRDGSWSLIGRYSNGARQENRLCATSLAMIAFQGAGNTHRSGTFHPQVARGLQQLRKWQNDDGDFWTGGQYEHRLYSQAQATIAVCELYGMTQDSDLRRLAQKAIDYAVRIQDEGGGWRYQPGSDSDTSVTGWFMMGLQSGLMAGLEVPSTTLERVSEYLDSAASYDGARYGYTAHTGATPPMTAEGLLCRQYLGWKQGDSRLLEGVAYLADFPIDWNDQNVYHWYYATQVMHHMEGRHWEDWNDILRTVVPARQVTEGKERGSWAPNQDRWGAHGGRLFTTCLYICMLEVYYRHLPIYSNVPRR